MASNDNKHTAAVLVWVQAALVAVGGVALIAFAARRRQRIARRYLGGHLLGHPGFWGLLLLLVAIGLVALGLGLHHRLRWAAPTAYVAEGVLGIGGLVGFHPLRSLFGLVLAIIVVVLVATDAPAPTVASDG